MTRFGMGVTLGLVIVILGIGVFFLNSSKFAANQNSVIDSGQNINPNTGVSGEPNPTPTPTPTPITGNPEVKGACYIGGCSSEVCSDQKDVVSNCIYKEEFACYRTAKCERQSTGQCDWTKTAALNSCINNANSGSRVAAGYLSGKVTIGPFCPVEKAGEPCPGPSDAYTSREAIVYESNGVTEKERIHLDQNGNYKFVLGPGTYYVQIAPAGIGPGEKKQAIVKSFETTIVNFDIDTGIR